MLDILVAMGIILENYAPTIPFPGENLTAKNKSKGIASLSKADQRRMLEALDDPIHPMHFEAVSSSDKHCEWSYFLKMSG
jgi:hypothetical protein